MDWRENKRSVSGNGGEPRTEHAEECGEWRKDAPKRRQRRLWHRACASLLVVTVLLSGLLPELSGGQAGTAAAAANEESYTVSRYAGDDSAPADSSDIVDGVPAAQAKISMSKGLAVDKHGNVYFSDLRYIDGVYKGWIRKIDASTGLISTVAGNGEPLNIQGTGAELAAGVGIGNVGQLAVDDEDNIYFVSGVRVFRIDAASGFVSIVAGNGSTRNAYVSIVEGAATETALVKVTGIAVGMDNSLYIAESGRTASGPGAIYKLNLSTGIISPFAGVNAAYSEANTADNIPASQAYLIAPKQLAVDSAGNLYYEDTYGNGTSYSTGNKVRKIRASDHTVVTVAGSGWKSGIVSTDSNGDGGLATEAFLRNPSGVAVDKDGNVYIADSGNHKIRKVNAETGIITTIAGNGSNSASDEVVSPQLLAVDPNGNVFVGYTGRNYISKLALNYTVAYDGNGSTDGSVPGPVAATGASRITAPENSGSLAKTGYTFSGWNTQADGEGTTYSPGEPLVMDYGNLTLYAKWTPNALYTLSYDGNGSNGGAVPASSGYPSGIEVPVAGSEGLTKTGYTFVGWNTQADGQGSMYVIGSSLMLGSGDITLYAQWAENPEYSIIYNGNGNTGGSTPVSATYEAGNEAIIAGAGSLIRTGHTFAGWGEAATATAATYNEGDTVPITDGNIQLYAVWGINSYRVNFETGNGTSIDTQTKLYNTTVTRPADPVRTGYIFDGWYTDSGFNNPYHFGTPATADLTLHAKWMVLRYTVSFSGGPQMPPAQNIEYNGKAIRPADPVWEGRTFLDWYYSGTNQLFDFNTPILANVSLIAKWQSLQYKVTFDTGGGSAISTQTVDYGMNAVEPEDAPGKPGYTFGGWYEDSTWTVLHHFSDPVTGDITLYAKWIPRSYTVSFQPNGGTEVDAQNVVHNGKAAQPDAPVKDTYGFGGWYSDSALKSPFNFNTPITANITLYAKWVADSYTVSFRSNGGSGTGSIAVPYGTPVQEPDAPTRIGYTFDGWYANENLTIKYDFGAPVEDDLTLYAKWTPILFTVSFDSGSGTSVTAQKVHYGENAAQPTAPTRAGYGFDGWYADEALTVKYDFGAAVTENIILYAKWKANSYTVSFNTGGGSAVSEQAVAYGGTVQQPIAPVKTGYTFDGWYSDGALTKAYDFSAPVQSDLMLYAKWKVNSYTVAFETNGGSAVSVQTVTYGEKAVQPDAPVKSGYVFGGWYADVDLTVAYTFDSPVSKELTLYAKWTAADTSGGGSGGSGPAGGSAPPAATTATSQAAQPANSTTGTAAVAPQTGGKISLGAAAVVDIPSGALAGSGAVEVKVEEVAAPPAAPPELTRAAKTYEFTVDGAGYTFAKPVKITLAFDPALIPAGQAASIYYYNEAVKEWTRVGGAADGGSITVEISHFTKFTVFAETPNASATLTDIAGHWAEAYIVKLVQSGAAQGYPDGTFQPGRAVTRAEFASLLVKALNLQATGASVFSDTDKHWAKDAVAIAADHGIVNGYEDGTFRPDRKVTRQEMVAMAVRAFGITGGSALGFADSAEIADWAKTPVQAAVQAGIVTGQSDNRFAPKVTATRAEVAVLIAKALELN